MARRLATAISSTQREHQMFMAVRRQEAREPGGAAGKSSDTPVTATPREDASAAPADAAGGAWR
jgi:hypothetical protein